MYLPLSLALHVHAEAGKGVVTCPFFHSHGCHVTALRLGTLQPRQIFARRVVVSSNDVHDAWHTMRLAAATWYLTTSKPCAVCMYVLEEGSRYI